MFLISFTDEGITLNESQQMLNEIEPTKSDYDKAEEQCTKLTRRYLYSWSGIVCLYACILLILPVMDILHGKFDASKWVTLFKLGYVK